jgi:hypothetical protein
LNGFKTADFKEITPEMHDADFAPFDVDVTTGAGACMRAAAARMSIACEYARA